MQGVSSNGTVICFNLDISNTPQTAAQLDLAGQAATELAPAMASHLACEAADGASCDFWTAASEGGLLLVRERHGDQRGAFGQSLYMFMGSAGARGLVTPIGR